MSRIQKEPVIYNVWTFPVTLPPPIVYDGTLVLCYHAVLAQEVTMPIKFPLRDSYLT
jgi:hypothetical protein